MTSPLTRLIVDIAPRDRAEQSLRLERDDRRRIHGSNFLRLHGGSVVAPAAAARGRQRKGSSFRWRPHLGNSKRGVGCEC